MFKTYDKFVVVDVETTGFYNSDDVIQIGVLEFDNKFNILNLEQAYFNTDKKISSNITNITGLNNPILKAKSSGLYFEDSIGKFEKYLLSGEYVIVGHNIKFDIRMLNANLERSGFSQIKAKNTICTMSKYKQRMGLKQKNGRIKDPKLGELYNYAIRESGSTKGKLDGIYTRYSGNDALAHDALYDVYMTYMSYRILK